MFAKKDKTILEKYLKQNFLKNDFKLSLFSSEKQKNTVFLKYKDIYLNNFPFLNIKHNIFNSPTKLSKIILTDSFTFLIKKHKNLFFDIKNEQINKLAYFLNIFNQKTLLNYSLKLYSLTTKRY